MYVHNSYTKPHIPPAVAKLGLLFPARNLITPPVHTSPKERRLNASPHYSPRIAPIPPQETKEPGAALGRRADPRAHKSRGNSSRSEKAVGSGRSILPELIFKGRPPARQRRPRLLITAGGRCTFVRLDFTSDGASGVRGFGGWDAGMGVRRGRASWDYGASGVRIQCGCTARLTRYEVIFERLEEYGFQLMESLSKC